MRQQSVRVLYRRLDEQIDEDGDGGGERMSEKEINLKKVIGIEHIRGGDEQKERKYQTHTHTHSSQETMPRNTRSHIRILVPPYITHHNNKQTHTECT